MDVSIRNTSGDDLNSFIHSFGKSTNQSYILKEDGSLGVSKSKSRIKQVFSRFSKSKSESTADSTQIAKLLSDVIKLGSNDVHSLDAKSLKIIGEIYLTSKYLQAENKPPLSMNLLNALVFSGRFKISDLIKNQDLQDQYNDYLQNSDEKYSLPTQLLIELHQSSEELGSLESFDSLIASDKNFYTEILEAKSNDFVKHLALGANEKIISEEFKEVKQLFNLQKSIDVDFGAYIDKRINQLSLEEQGAIFNNAPKICNSLKDSSITNLIFNRCFESLKDGKGITTDRVSDFLKPWIKERALKNLTSLHIGVYDSILTNGAFKTLIRNMPNLEVINLRASFYNNGARVNDELKFLAEHCKNLKSLSIGYQNKIDENGIIELVKKCKGIEILDLNRADAIQNVDNKLFDQLRELRNLKELHFDTYNGFLTKDVETLQEKFPDLKTQGLTH